MEALMGSAYHDDGDTIRVELLRPLGPVHIARGDRLEFIDRPKTDEIVADALRELPVALRDEVAYVSIRSLVRLVPAGWQAVRVTFERI